MLLGEQDVKRHEVRSKREVVKNDNFFLLIVYCFANAGKVANKQTAIKK
jgi:hypothetical protein